MRAVRRGEERGGYILLDGPSILRGRKEKKEKKGKKGEEQHSGGNEIRVLCRSREERGKRNAICR